MSDAVVVAESVPFEKMLERLEGIVKKLEAGELSLETSLKSYEEGIGLVRLAQERLDQMEGKIEELMADGKKKPLNVATSQA